MFFNFASKSGSAHCSTTFVLAQAASNTRPRPRPTRVNRFVISTLHGGQLDDEVYRRNRVNKNNNGRDIDGVLVLRAVKITLEERYVQAQATGTRYNSFYAYVGEYRPTYSSYTTDDKLVHLETNLYAVDGEKLIWTGKTETFSPSDVDAYLIDLTKTVLDEINRTGFIQ